MWHSSEDNEIKFSSKRRRCEPLAAPPVATAQQDEQPSPDSCTARPANQTPGDGHPKEDDDKGPSTSTRPQPPRVEGVSEPLTYLSSAQADVLRGPLQGDAENETETMRQARTELAAFALPAWVPQRLVAQAQGFDMRGIANALRRTRGVPYLWATEFENVHSLWVYDEPSFAIDGVVYRDSEDYYHRQKPDPWDERAWGRIKDDVMRNAIRAKLVVAGHALRQLLCATRGHPLLSIKRDAYWGFDARDGGANRLAELWMELRDELEPSDGHGS